MRATIDIDDKLLAEARQLTSAKTKKELINLSLRELIRKKRVEHLLGRYGTSPVDITTEDVAKARRDDR
jgi:Arc/MetJ family transcription regulator